MYSNVIMCNSTPAYENLLFSSSLKVCLCLMLYHYTINNDHTWYNICIAWFLNIRTSTCFYTILPSTILSFVILYYITRFTCTLNNSWHNIGEFGITGMGKRLLINRRPEGKWGSNVDHDNRICNVVIFRLVRKH